MQSVLLHELIHHMQYKNKVDFNCLGKYEKEAYYLQDIWLLKQGEKNVMKTLDLNSLYLIMLFSCGDYNYLNSFDNRRFFSEIH